MPWQFYLGLILGIPMGGIVGFVFGRLRAGVAVQVRAVAKEDAIDDQAEKDRKQIEDDLSARIDETGRADARKLKELLDADFAATSPDALQHPSVEPPGKPGT